MQLQTLEQRWHSLFPRADQKSVSKEFQCLRSRYGEPHRHYHTLAHIEHCLHWLDEVYDQIPDPLSVELALWFHDVVYNARKQDNERISAEYAIATLSLLKTDRQRRDEVRNLIMVTVHPSQPLTDHQCWMVDIDLAILGAEARAYSAYAAQVRQEYAHVPEALYRAGRKALLQQFLQLPQLYHTEYFQDRLESPARDNLQWEIDQL